MFIVQGTASSANRDRALPSKQPTIKGSPRGQHRLAPRRNSCKLEL
jgi:hypothetical protein